MGRSKTRNSVYCDYDNYVFYDKHSKRCKACPMCAPGQGMKDMTFYKIKMDPDRGALQCRYCVNCTLGYTFSDNKSYDDCKPCDPCANGLFPSKNCTTTSNTQCIKVVKHENSSSLKPLPITDNEGSPMLLHVGIGGLIISVVVLLLLVIVLAVSCFTIRLYRRNRKLRKENAKLKSEAICKHETILLNPIPPSRPMSPPPLPNQEGNMLETDDNGERYDYPEQCCYTELPMRTPANTDKVDEDDYDYEEIVTAADVQNDKENKLTDRNVRIAAKYLAGHNNHIKFASFLEIENADVNIINTEHANDLQEQAYKVIVKWQQLQGDKATKSKLCSLLKQFGRTDIADQLNQSS